MNHVDIEQNRGAIMKTMLVPMTEPNCQDAILSNACVLAKRFDGFLTGLFIRPDPRAAIPFMGEGLTADAIQDLCDAADKEGLGRAAATQAVFAKIVEDHGLAIADASDVMTGPVAIWEETVGMIAEKVGRHARLADLAIVPQPVDENSTDSSELLNDVLFRSGRPLLMSPPKAFDSIGKRCVIGWNGRAECARTVASALPVLARAEDVHIVTVGEEHPDRPSLEALRVYLSRYDISAQTHHEATGGGSIAQILAERVDQIEGDLLVIGAYSHSRWREMIIGGATREIIQDSAVPVFMSH